MAALVVYDNGSGAMLGAARVASSLSPVVPVRPPYLASRCPSGCSVRPGTEAEEGYLLVDAVVALMILSTVLVLSFASLQVAQNLAGRSEEMRRADLILNTVMLDGENALEPSHGETDGFAWFLTVAPTAVVHPVSLCDRRVVVQNLQTARSFEAATLAPCPLADS